MNVARDRKEGAISIINKRDNTENIIDRFGMKTCSPAYMPGVGPELSLHQPQEIFLDEESKKRYQSITGVVMNFGQIFCYDIFFGVNQRARAMSRPFKAHMGAAKHLLCYLAGFVNFSIT